MDAITLVVYVSIPIDCMDYSRLKITTVSFVLHCNITVY